MDYKFKSTPVMSYAPLTRGEPLLGSRSGGGYAVREFPASAYVLGGRGPREDLGGEGRGNSLYLARQSISSVLPIVFRNGQYATNPSNPTGEEYGEFERATNKTKL